MAKSKDFDADGVLNDIDNFMFSAFDALIKISVKRLGTEEASPVHTCLLYTSPSPRDATLSRMPSSA